MQLVIDLGDPLLRDRGRFCGRRLRADQLRNVSIDLLGLIFVEAHQTDTVLFAPPAESNAIALLRSIYHEYPSFLGTHTWSYPVVQK